MSVHLYLDGCLYLSPFCQDELQVILAPNFAPRRCIDVRRACFDPGLSEPQELWSQLLVPGLPVRKIWCQIFDLETLQRQNLTVVILFFIAKALVWLILSGN
ncbi:hypothetical protein EDD85DRAFT_786779 [Armillaria nabsnona]|nr:hypothetical protein EDD85DRAFT_786779 [Armillaria nabsnona]